jgi:outer membrane biosynthesis protein TonB
MCERIICSPFASGITAILSAVYFIRYPSLSSAIGTTLIVKGVDLLQKILRKYDLERFKGFPQNDLDEPEEEQPEEEPEEKQPEEEQPEEEQDNANDEDEEYIPSHKPNLKRRTYNLRNRSD